VKKKVNSKILANDVLFFPGHANIVAFKLDSSIIITDTGRNIHDARSIRSEVEEYFGGKITTVIITHLHSDHTNSLPLYPDCDIIASNQTIKYLQKANRKKIKGMPTVFPTIGFEDQYVIEEGKHKVLVKRTGGHTPDSSYLYSSEHNLLIAGDNLRSDFLWGGRQSDPETWLSAFKEYVSYNTECIISGHGEVFNRDEVKILINLILKMKKITFDLIKENRSLEEMIVKLNKIQPKKGTAIFIHDSTVTKWTKFWVKSLKRKSKPK
jgi:glyoxylase-like metal-dependent hydrolase (beta-lactamase superfamily II)